MAVTGKDSLMTFTFRMDNPTDFYRGQIALLNLYIADADANPLYASNGGVSVRLEDIVIPAKTALAPNYPNPFNPETWIPYQLSEASDVTITIYDVGGRMVRRIPLGYKEAGVYYSKSKAAYWDGKNSEPKSL
ncbi:hypothetical protein HYR99_21635 [Candidatus Poribacteria bacterium]|nr:hypothetical protein [Candidatus Poribacteria bacterium]